MYLSYLICRYFIQFRPIDESNQVKDQPLARVNRNHLSNVKDLNSSSDQPLLLGCGVFGRCYKMYYRGCQLLLNSLTSISQQSAMLLKKPR